MKNHYDKIFLALATLVLLLSLSVFFLGKSGIDEVISSTKTLMSTGPQGDEWEEQTVRDYNFGAQSKIVWQYPDSQDDKGDWVFQVFTPPMVWKTDEGEFKTIAPVFVPTEVVVEAEVQTVVCDLALVEVTSAEYGVILTGSSGKADNPIFEFKDSKNGIEFGGRKNVELSYQDPEDYTGKTMISLGLTVLDFRKERFTHENGGVEILTIVTLEDKNLSRKIELVQDKPTILLDERKMKMASTIGDDFEQYVSKVGDVIDYNSSKYTVVEINFEDKYIVLNQVSADAEVLPETITLYLPKPVLPKVVEDDSDEEEEEDEEEDEEEEEYSAGKLDASGKEIIPNPYANGPLR